MLFSIMEMEILKYNIMSSEHEYIVNSRENQDAQKMWWTKATPCSKEVKDFNRQKYIRTKNEARKVLSFERVRVDFKTT